MINRSLLLKDLQALLKRVEADLLGRSESMPEVAEWLGEEYGKAKRASRTGLSFEEWRSDTVTHVGAAWVLNGVFVRFLEDNGLVAVPRIAGAVGVGLDRARDEHEAYFRSHPRETDREYWLDVFDGLAGLPGSGAIFGMRNPVRMLPNWLSGDGAGLLLGFFQRVDAGTGLLVHDFRDESWNTRFLGDLYQDLSERARKKYALLQTPDFVEGFILDRTLEPALDAFEPEFRSGEFRMIDPACGSGHFLLGAFGRLMDRWRKVDPNAKEQVLAQRSLDGVYGVDLNPFAVAIARFRLMLAAMGECGIKTLKNASDFQIHVACGDSLLHGDWRQGELVLESLDLPEVYCSQDEDRVVLDRVLVKGRYHAVVANPPYITPKDKQANENYRKRHSTCHMKYSLSVPFMERIFNLAVPSGFTGQITANSFMKREFGKKLIEKFFPTVDLTHVIDTSGAYIPGHGTPTVILLGRNRQPVAETIRTVMGIKGEPSTPENPAEGLVWSAIRNQVDICGSQSDFVSVSDSERLPFYKHPWSIGGGGAAELKEQIESGSSTKLAALIDSIGFMAITGEDDVFSIDHNSAQRFRVTTRKFCTGDVLRDWQNNAVQGVIIPYNFSTQSVKSWSPSQIPNLMKYLWAFRTPVRIRNMFGKSIEEHGFSWFEYIQFIRERATANLSIAFAFVATHNHFVLDRGGKVFNRTAPVIKLPAEATEDDHLALLGLINSSTACFWGRQTFFAKGGFGSGKWEERLEWDGTKLGQFPLPGSYPLSIAQKLDEFSRMLSQSDPTSVLLSQWSVLQDSLTQTYVKRQNILSLMIALQEELDWQCYQFYNLISEDKTYKADVPPIQLGQRAFEIVMARKMAADELETTWFERHNSTPITELPEEWPDDYKQLIQRRIETIETNPNIALIEQPEYKRRWNTETWDSQLDRALHTWLLDRLETYFDFDGRMNPEANPTSQLESFTLTTSSTLTDLANRDPQFLQIAALYRKAPNPNLQTLIDDLIETASVPHLPILRYKPTGLRKRTEWEQTWTLQRQEDAIDDRTQLPKDHPDYLTLIQAKTLKTQQIGTIPVPAKYTSTDFLKPHHWKQRGKLDVPKERWISFPHTETNDGKLPIAWAGYNHLQLTQAITTHYIYIQETIGGSEDPRLLPLLASLLELLPWLHQWHSTIDPEYGYSLSTYYEEFLLTETRRLGHTLETLKQWEPPQRPNRTPNRKR